MSERTLEPASKRVEGATGQNDCVNERADYRIGTWMNKSGSRDKMHKLATKPQPTATAVDDAVC